MISAASPGLGRSEPLESAAPTGGGARRVGRLARWLFAVGLLALLVVTVGPRDLAACLAAARVEWLLLGGAILVLVLGLGGLNTWILLRAVHPLPFGSYVGAYLLGWAVGLFVPGQVGDAAQALVLKRRGVPLLVAGAAYALDKAITGATLALVAIIGIAIYLPDLLGAGAAVLVAGLLIAFLAGRASSRLGGRIGDAARRFFKELGRYRNERGAVALNVTLTVLKWVLLTGFYIVAFRAFSTSLSVVAAAFLPVMIGLVGYIPVTTGGLGTIEATAVLLFGLEDVGQATVLSVYLLVRGFNYALAALLVLVLRIGRKEDA